MTRRVTSNDLGQVTHINHKSKSDLKIVNTVSNRILIRIWVFGPWEWFKRLRLELECLKMASVGEKLGIEAESVKVNAYVCIFIHVIAVFDAPPAPTHPSTREAKRDTRGRRPRVPLFAGGRRPPPLWMGV